MNLLDIALVAIVAWSAIAGFMVGLTRVGIGFAATVFGLVFAFWFYYIPAGAVHGFVKSVAISNFIGFMAVFIFFVMAGAIIGKILSRMLKIIGLSFFDRLGGAAFGFVRGALLVVGVVLAITAFAPAKTPDFVAKSRIMPYATSAAGVMALAAPRSLKEAYADSLKKLKKIWNEHQAKQLKGETV